MPDNLDYQIRYAVAEGKDLEARDLIDYQRHLERGGYDYRGITGPAACHKAGHVEGCPGRAGGDHELLPGWIGFEDEDGRTVEVEVTGA